MIKNVTGIVISEVPYKENSKILNILTREGIIGVISKGCKNLKSPLRIISEKLKYCEFIIYYKEDGLSTLKEGVILDNFDNIRRDLTKISYLSYLTELVAQVVKQAKDANIYELFISTVRKIDQGLNPMVMTNILEIKLLDYLGVPINLSSCAKCGSKKNIITIDADIGGYICTNCYTNEKMYDEKVRNMLRKYYLVDIDSITELKIKDYVIESINYFLNVYYDRYTGLYIHSKNFLNRNIDY